MKRFLLLAALLFAAAGLFAARAEASVALRTQTEIDHPAIRLADVFDGLPDGLDRDIATAPIPGASVTYDVGVLSWLAQKYRLDWQPQTLHDRSVLIRAATRISQDVIRDAVAAKIKEVRPDFSDTQMEVVFENKNLEVLLPTNQLPHFVLNRFAYDAETRRFKTDLTAGSVSLPVAGHVSMKKSIPVLTRRLEEGAVISESDLSWETLPAERITADIITAPGDLIGREVRRDTMEGVPLHSRDVVQPRLVTHGSLVTMRIETTALLVTSQGKAMQDGTLGATIRLTNTQSKRVVEGIVVGPGMVRVPLPQQNRPLAQAEAATGSRWP